MLTEIWFKTKDKAIRLPVIPAEFEKVTSANYESNSVIGLGDISTFGGNGLSQMSLSSFFPAHNYSFNEYSELQHPYKLVGQFEDWKNKGEAVRLILTGTNINQSMYITNFSYGERDGTGDVYYNMDLIEYRPITIPVINNVTNTQNTSRDNDVSNTNSNNANNSTQKTHKVVKGDSLWAIAQKHYGKGSLYPKIKEANKSKYPSLAKNNVIYVNWELIIP